MLIRTPADLGALIRDTRQQKGLGQQALAKEIGVSRQWLIDVEKGKPRAEVGLVLRALDALGIALSPAAANKRSARADIDRIVDNARKPDR